MKQQTTTRLTLWINRIISGVVVLVFFTLPWLLKFYRQLRPLDREDLAAIFLAYYACTGVVLAAQWNIERLLKNLLALQVFIPENVTRIRRIRWCCAGVSLICLPASFFYLPLVFLVVIMGFLSLVVTVVVDVMKAAVAIREENDMTI